MVAVPHLCRDLALSYEGRNDFFATHPANVQRAMANEVPVPLMYSILLIYIAIKNGLTMVFPI